MESDKYNLNRFIIAQERDYSIALRELTDGRKRSHRMWYIFPQLKHFGHSNTSKFYGLSGTEEAAAYLASNDVFARVLDKYFGGQRDNRTIRLIKGAEKTT